MFRTPQYYILVFIILAVTGEVFAQKNERIKYSADQLEFIRKEGESYRKLTDNVVFTQEGTTVYCDSSFFYSQKNVMEAFGHVKIVQDSTTITSKKLVYEGDNRMAKLREEVVYVRGERKLYTDFLNYDMEADIANYFNNGKLIDTTNVLISEIGYYFAKDNYAQFYQNVVLEAPEYTLKTDTLRYNTITKVAYTYGRTEIISEGGTVLHAKGGEFRTVTDQSEFESGEIETDDYILKGDQLYFDDIRKYYKAIGNVKLTAKENDVIIVGDEGFYDKTNEISKIYGKPLMKRVLEADTFYMSADTLVALESKYDSLKRILAYYGVKAYKEGLQGIADSVAYFRADSIIYFYQDPVMWNNNTQVEGDTISMVISENEIRKMNLHRNSFMISEDTIKNYNQIKGRKMEAFFENNEINYIDVNGNGEILYFALEDGDSVLMGMNKIFCARMTIGFEDQELAQFKVYTNPEAQFIPPHELTPEVQRLEGFAWRKDERPELYDVAPYLNPLYDSLSQLEIAPDTLDAGAGVNDATEKPVKSLNQSGSDETSKSGKPQLLAPKEGTRESENAFQQRKNSKLKKED